MKRLYFLLPNLDSTHAVVDELRESGVEDKRIHIIAKEGTELADLPDASILENTDYLRGIEVGIAGGGAAGLIAGLFAVTFPPAGIVLGGATVAYMAGMGASIGALVSGLIGLDFPNQRLLKFEKAISGGEILMLVDVPFERLGKTEDLVKRHHPEVEFGGTDSTVPPIRARA